MKNNTDTAEALQPSAQPAPEMPFDTLEETADTSWLRDHCHVSDVPFFSLVLLDKLVRRPYHTVMLEGPFKIKELVEDHRKHTFRSEKSFNRSGCLRIDRLLLLLEGEVFAHLEGDFFKIYAPTPEAAQAAAERFRRYVKPQAADKPCFFVISIEDCGPCTETVDIERLAPFTNEELALHYGEDFPAWEQQWTERMDRTPSGLTIFHGPPGCGKTSYLRALMARLLKNAVFYFIPVSEAEMLSNPRFMSFWMKQTQRHPKRTKIVLLEDAEDFLLPRETGCRDKVSNLLNLADGFLGDHLRMHVIATTNSPVRELDRALLRPGRLVGAHEFRRLTRPEAQRLAKAKGLTLPDQEDYSLAEMYCGAASNPAFNANRQIGFAQ